MINHITTIYILGLANLSKLAIVTKFAARLMLPGRNWCYQRFLGKGKILERRDLTLAFCFWVALELRVNFKLRISPTAGFGGRYFLGTTKV